jgi:hypothetical protein
MIPLTNRSKKLDKMRNKFLKEMEKIDPIEYKVTYPDTRLTFRVCTEFFKGKNILEVAETCKINIYDLQHWIFLSDIMDSFQDVAPHEKASLSSIRLAFFQGWIMRQNNNNFLDKIETKLTQKEN